MATYRTTTGDNPLEMPAIEVYYDDFDEALRDALGAAVSPLAGNDPSETVTISRETGADDAVLTYTLHWTGTWSKDIVTTVTTVTIEELDDDQT